MTPSEWEQGARDLDALREMVASEPAIDRKWTCGTASIEVGSWVHIHVGTQKRQMAPPRGKQGDALLVWASLALAAEARLCRARAVLETTFADLIDEEARR